MAKICSNCGALWDDKSQPGFRQACDCGQAWHCCVHCRFYDANASQWCTEPQARDNRPAAHETARANRCEFFVLADREGGASSSRTAQAKAGLAALFGETPDETSAPVAEWMKTGNDPETGTKDPTA